MSDLVEFLHARLDEDERDAQEVERLIESGLEVPGAVTYSPNRVLREVEAKRRIIAEYERMRAEVENHWHLIWDMLKVLALPYADHPDYDEEWRHALT